MHGMVMGPGEPALTLAYGGMDGSWMDETPTDADEGTRIRMCEMAVRRCGFCLVLSGCAEG